LPITAEIGVLGVLVQREYCGDEKKCSRSATHEFADIFLARAVGIMIGGVDEIAACFCEREQKRRTVCRDR
jgi:hypothetical protein